MDENNSNQCYPIGVEVPTVDATSQATFRSLIADAVAFVCTSDIIIDAPVYPQDYIWLTDDGSSVVAQKFFKASVAGGAGNVVFYTDTNGDGSGDAIYSTLTADMLTCVVDGVSDQYAFPTITVDSSKKFVTVNVKRQNFTTGNALLTLLGGLTTLLSGVTYVNAANGVGVKMIVGIDD